MLMSDTDLHAHTLTQSVTTLSVGRCTLAAMRSMQVQHISLSENNPGARGGGAHETLRSHTQWYVHQRLTLSCTHA
jgi:hypothetical protein